MNTGKTIFSQVMEFLPLYEFRMGFRALCSRNTLANTNNQRDWHIYADFAQVLIHQARELYLEDSFGIDLKDTVYALDSTRNLLPSKPSIICPCASISSCVTKAGSPSKSGSAKRRVVLPV